MESDLALDLANLDSGHFADIAPSFELRDKAVKPFVMVSPRPELVPETKEGAQAVELVQARPGLPGKHGFVTDVLVNLRAVLQGHGEIAEAVLDQGTVAVVAEAFGVSGGGLEIEEQEDPVLGILPGEGAGGRAELAADLLRKLAEADRTV
jgi:hypothetical protein